MPYPGLAARGLQLNRGLRRAKVRIEIPFDPLDYVDPDRDWTVYLGRPDLDYADLDKLAAVAKCLIEHGAEIRERRNRERIQEGHLILTIIERDLHHLVMPLADSLCALFEEQTWETETRWHGVEYFPPDARLRSLLLEALHVIDPEINNSIEAVRRELDWDVYLWERHGFKERVWLGKHTTTIFGGLEQQIDHPNVDVRTAAAATLIELGHETSHQAERVLLQTVQNSAPSVRQTILETLIDPIAAKLSHPEAFLQAACGQREEFTKDASSAKADCCQTKVAYDYSFLYSGILVLEIIRRLGPSALEKLQTIRNLWEVDVPVPLAWGVYHALIELEGLDLEDEEVEQPDLLMRRRRVDLENAFCRFLGDSPDLAWCSLMERLERILEEAR